MNNTLSINEIEERELEREMQEEAAHYWEYQLISNPQYFYARLAESIQDLI